MNTQDWRRLNELADRLETAWEKADDVDLGQFLPPSGDPLRASVLYELLTTDLEIRWRRKQGRPLEFYVALFPELGSAAALPPKLIYEEYRVRCRHGDHPELALYQERFPDQFAHLQKLLQQDPVATLTGSVSTPAAQPMLRTATLPPPEKKPVLTIGGGYTLEKLIGRGGFGEVWRAVAPGGFPAAVKIITRPADHEERIREERALNVIKQLNHHFLIKTIASYAEEDKLYIIMDLADGSLRERLKLARTQKQTGVPVEELLRYFRESAEALDYLHSQDVLHRDIKPDNILLVGNHVRLADFGLARHQEQILASVSGAGTPAYMAPEVWRGKASKHSDQYSLAYTYAELRLGHRAFTSTDYAGVMFDHLDHVPNLEPLAEPEKQVLLKALAKKPDERYPTCLAFIEALEDVHGFVPRASRQFPTIGNTLPHTPSKGQGASPTQIGGGSGGASPTARRPQDASGGDSDDETFNSLLPNQVSGLRNTTAPPPGPTLRKPSPKRRRGVLPFVIVGVLFVAVAGGVAALVVPGLLHPNDNAKEKEKDKDKEKDEPSFALTALPAATIHPGEKPSVVIRVERHNLTEPIRLTFETSLPIKLQPATIPGDASSVEVILTAEAGATKAEGPIRIHATSGTLTQDGSFTVSIEPPLTAPWVPEHYKAAPNAQPVMDFRKRAYFDRLISDLPDVPPVTFVLIPQKSAADLPTYYLMETKVSNALAAALAKKCGAAGAWPTEGDKANLPAYGMTAADAVRLATVLDGALPTTKQWDRAAGFETTERPSPFVGGPDAAVNRWKEGPRAVTDRSDLSVFKIADLGGNGTELTRNLTAETEATRKLAVEQFAGWKDAPPDTLVILRGQRYTAPKPLRFADLAEQQTLPQVQFYRVGSPFTGFRVVIDPQ